LAPITRAIIKGIRWIGGKIRSNAKDGITIDGGTHVPNGVFIEHSLIEGNNTSDAGYNGISISAHPAAVSVTGNIIQNYPEAGGATIRNLYFLRCRRSDLYEQSMLEQCKGLF
jgi:hypothetical protein